MSDFQAEASSTARGFKLSWSLDYDDVANTLTLNVVQTNPDDGTPLPAVAGEAGGITVVRANGVERSFDFFALGFVNAGPQVFTGVTLRVNGGGRARGFTLTTWFNPPSG